MLIDTAGGEALVLFAGGRTDSGPSGVVDIYNVCGSDCSFSTSQFAARRVLAAPHILLSRSLGHGPMTNLMNHALI